MKTKIAIGIVLLALLVGVGVAYAQTQEPIELQPYWKFMNGEEEMGLGWAFDYGTLIMTAEDTLFTCGCQGGCGGTEVLPGDTPVSTEEPKDTSEPTQEPTDPPPTEKPKKEKCNKGGGNGPERCDPGNNPDKGNDDEN